ncbi:MAG: hypothetical protein HYY84_14685 [Deltaproteobacteria bacterium]|nr:hypothetical protein [Deltaproteobacteria bacterium]
MARQPTLAASANRYVVAWIETPRDGDGGDLVVARSVEQGDAGLGCAAVYQSSDSSFSTLSIASRESAPGEFALCVGQIGTGVDGGAFYHTMKLLESDGGLPPGCLAPPPGLSPPFAMATAGSAFPRGTKLLYSADADTYFPLVSFTADTTCGNNQICIASWPADVPTPGALTPLKDYGGSTFLSVPFDAGENSGFAALGPGRIGLLYAVGSNVLFDEIVVGSLQSAIFGGPKMVGNGTPFGAAWSQRAQLWAIVIVADNALSVTTIDPYSGYNAVATRGLTSSTGTFRSAAITSSDEAFDAGSWVISFVGDVPTSQMTYISLFALRPIGELSFLVPNVKTGASGQVRFNDIRLVASKTMARVGVVWNEEKLSPTTASETYLNEVFLKCE